MSDLEDVATARSGHNPKTLINKLLIFILPAFYMNGYYLNFKRTARTDRLVHTFLN
jgi:hypothetical protein